MQKGSYPQFLGTLYKMRASNFCTTLCSCNRLTQIETLHINCVEAKDFFSAFQKPRYPIRRQRKVRIIRMWSRIIRLNFFLFGFRETTASKNAFDSRTRWNILDQLITLLSSSVTVTFTFAIIPAVYNFRTEYLQHLKM